MAVGLAARALGKNKNVTLISAGIIATKGLPASPNAIKVMEEEGIDISGHETQPLTRDLVDSANMVFVMTQWHKLEVIGFLDKPGKEIYLLKEFAPDANNYDTDIPDPIGKSIDFYRGARDEIEKCMDGVVKKILKK